MMLRNIFHKKIQYRQSMEKYNFQHISSEQKVPLNFFCHMYICGTLCVHLLLHFYTDLFEILHVLMSWPDNLNVLKI